MTTHDWLNVPRRFASESLAEWVARVGYQDVHPARVLYLYNLAPVTPGTPDGSPMESAE